MTHPHARSQPGTTAGTRPAATARTPAARPDRANGSMPSPRPAAPAAKHPDASAEESQLPDLALYERLTGEEFRLAYPDHMMLSPDEKILFMSGAKFHPGFWMGTHVADTTIVRSRDHGRSWDTEPKGFAVAPRANIEALTMACWPGGYKLFVGDTEGTVHMSEDGGDS